MVIGKLTRRVFLLTLVALLPATGVLFYNLNSMRSEREGEVRAEALRNSHLIALEVQRIVEGAENLMIAVSSSPVAQALNAPGCQKFLDRLGPQVPKFASIALIDIHGLFVCRYEPRGGGLSFADRRFLQQAISSRRFMVGTYTSRSEAGPAILPLALPLRDARGIVFGAVIAAVDLKWLTKSLAQRELTAGRAVAVIDANGTIIAREPRPELYVGKPVTAALRKHALGGEPVAIQGKTQDGIDRVIGYYPLPAIGLTMAAGISTDQAYAAVRKATRIGYAVIFASLVLSFFLAWFTSRSLIQKPVVRLIDTIHSWRAGDETARTGMDDRADEIAVVGRAIDEFLVALEKARASRDAAERQRELLVGELDHRVKNLLATMQTIARQTFRDVNNVDDAVTAFNRRLTAISEAHALLINENWSSVGIAGVVSASTRPFDTLKAPQIVATGPDFLLRPRAVLSLSLALHEMCTNAVKYGALKTQDGRISIRWEIVAGKGDTDMLRLVWIEAGGPAVMPPTRTGFGSKMIERVLSYELDASAEMVYGPAGLVCTLSAPMDRLRAAEVASEAA